MELTISDMKEILGHQAATPDRDLGVCIVVYQRGFVSVGRGRLEGGDIVLTGARTIRRWGTSNGLGQLAKDGPQDETVLDPAADERCNYLAVVKVLACDEGRWRDAV